MNQIKSYCPTFCESGYGIKEERKIVSFETLEQLLQISWVKSRAEEPRFYRFSVLPAISINDKPTLMVEYDSGNIRFVVGFLDQEVAELPKTDKLK